MGQEIDELNRSFGIEGQLVFRRGPGDLAFAEIDNAFARAQVSLQGAQVLAYEPHGERPILFLSEQARFAPGVAIRGGVPICWPWFGNHPTDPAKPAHGFARTADWAPVQAGLPAWGGTQLRLRLHDDERTRSLWPHRFELDVVITVGATLSIELSGRNTGDESIELTAALHGYFAVDDIERVGIEGLDGAAYIDKTDGMKRKRQEGAVRIEGETDRIYVGTTGDCAIDDTVRRLVVSKQGSFSTVVWNPWVDKARRLGDLRPGEYRRMVCVEVANAGDDVVTVPPGGEHSLTATVFAAAEGAQ